MARSERHTEILERCARTAIAEAGLLVEFSPEARSELAGLGPAYPQGGGWHDLTSAPWCSIDNDDSRDLDQLTLAEPLADGVIRVSVAIADVDSTVRLGGAIDTHAARNTATVYTPATNFPMLPRELSEDRTSLNEAEDRTAVVARFSVASDGERFDEEVVFAMVRNRAKLAYPSVGDFLAGDGPLPPAAACVEGMDEQLRLQDSAAQALRMRRILRGALQFEDRDAGAMFAEGMVVDLRIRPRNRATELIENFMISANGVATRFLRAHGFPSIQRVVRSPKRWNAIAELAAELKSPLPPQPDSIALQEFLAAQRKLDPESFADLSLTIIKLLGRGEYVPVSAGGPRPGHFGLAVRDYAHSTAPNRRFPDLVTQRMLKAALDGHRAPYDDHALTEIAEHCTDTEVVIDKIERRLRKSAAALMLEGRDGERFDAIVTGASSNACWVRLRKLPIEGRVIEGARGLRVGKLVTVKLLRTDVEAGFIDFERV